MSDWRLLPSGEFKHEDFYRLASSGGGAAAEAAGVIYVSCDPATLTRDLGGFVRAGFRVVYARALPMFPRCAAFESVVFLERIQ